METKSSTKSEVVTTFRLAPAEHATLKLLAEREGRSLNAQVRHILRQLAEQKAAA